MHSNISVISIRVYKWTNFQLAVGDHFSWLELIYAFNIVRISCTFMLGHYLIILQSLKQTEILYQSYDLCMQVFNEIPWAFINILRSDLSKVSTVVSKRFLASLIGFMQPPFNLVYKSKNKRALFTQGTNTIENMAERHSQSPLKIMRDDEALQHQDRLLQSIEANT